MIDIDQIDENTFSLFVQSRYQPQLSECKRKRLWNALVYQILQWSIIILSALTAILVGLQSLFTDPTITIYLKSGAIVSSIIITGLASALKTFNYQKRWTDYQNRITDLDSENDLFIGGAGDYADLTTSNERRKLFIKNVSKIIRESERRVTTTYGGTV